MLDENLERLTDDLLKKGVAVNSYIVRTRNGEKRIFDIDFFAHDKVFEDKITELERTINHELDNWDKLGITYQEILNMKAENDLLKQRIAELESKESAKPMRIEFHADNGEMLTPLEVANSLINQNTFKVDELKELAEILEVYHRHHRDKDKDIDDLW